MHVFQNSLYVLATYVIYIIAIYALTIKRVATYILTFQQIKYTSKRVATYVLSM